MLVLSRKKDQTIRIGSDVVVKVIATGKTVKIGIEAPITTKILRGELSDGVDDFSVLAMRPPSPFKIEYRGAVT